jgi:hypothetical protein
LALFADDTRIYATAYNERYVLRKLQCGLTAIEASCEQWHIKVNEDKDPGHILFSQTWTGWGSLTLKGRNIPFVKEVKYLGVIFDRKVTWRCHTVTIATKALRTFIRIYSLLKSERLSAKTKLTLYKVLIRSKMTYACPT